MLCHDNGEILYLSRCDESTMKLPIYHLDAFTDRPFAGNPAAVVILETWLDDALLQAIAAENNLSETAFVIPGDGQSHLRWFSPKQEIDLCGHATLAAAQVLFAEYFRTARQLEFMTRSGVLEVSRELNTADASAAGRLWLDFPARPGQRVEVTPAMGEALGCMPQEAWLARDLMCVFASAAEVQSLTPDFPKISRLDAFAVIACAPGDDVDFVSRFFAPRAGVDEDPVTGSAHCTLIPYWAARLDKPALQARQLSARGGRLWCEARGERVGIGGQVVAYSRGEILLAE